MITVAALEPQRLRALLAGDGLYLCTGAFVIRLQSDIAAIERALVRMYADYPVADAHSLADFHVRVVRPRNWRRWLRPQVVFLLDGQQPFKPLPLAHAFPLLEWGMNWCVSSHAHNYLVLHAAVLERGGRALVLPAPPGSGKSTLCAALAYAGWRLLSDELALVRLQDGMIVPLPRPVSLKNQSIELLQTVLPEAVFSAPVRNTSKGTVAHLRAPADSVARQLEPACPAWIVFPRYVSTKPGISSSGAAADAAADAGLQPVAKADAHMRVAGNAFNYALLAGDGFDAVAALVQRAACHDFSYTSLDDAMRTLEALTTPAAAPAMPAPATGVAA